MSTPNSRATNVRLALPAMLTLGSFFCGLSVIRLCLEPAGADTLRLCAVLIAAALACDFLDGLVARAVDGTSAFGAELDSLSDVVAFGVAPAMLAYRFCLVELATPGFLCAAVFASCGAVRLARFNVMSARSAGSGTDSVGLTVPMAAITLTATVLAVPSGVDALWPVGLTAGAALLLALLMVSTIRYRTLKGLTPTARGAILAALATVIVVLSVTLGPERGLLVSAWGYVFLGHRVGRAAPQAHSESLR